MAGRWRDETRESCKMSLTIGCLMQRNRATLPRITQRPTPAVRFLFAITFALWCYAMHTHPSLYEVTAPPSLPAPQDGLIFRGGCATSKKAAKYSAAYEAVFGLHNLVSSTTTLSVSRSRGSVTDDIDGESPINVNHLPQIMEASVFDI